MPFNGSGSFTPIPPPDYPAVAGTTVKASQFNNVMTDVFNGFNNCLTRDGQGRPTANINWAGYNLTNIGTLGSNSLAVITNGTIGGTLTVTGGITNTNLVAPTWSGVKSNPTGSQPAFNYYSSTGYTNPASGTVMTYDTAVFPQQGSLFNPATGILTITAATAGLWLIGFMANITGTTSGNHQTLLSLFKNGSNFQQALGNVGSTLPIVTIGTSILLNLAAGDTLEVQINAANMNVNSPQFFGYFLG